jgi:hypothetical protein
MEIGSSMASMYLLQNTDHYTLHIFILFWWKLFVNETFNIIMIQNHNIDIIMEDVLQEEIKKLPFSNNKKVGDYDIDIKMDILHLENKNTSLLKNNNDENLKIHKYQTNSFELNVENQIINTDFLDDDMEHNDQFEVQNENGDENKNKATSEDEDEEENEDNLTDKLLLISQDGQDFVALSKVDDYKYRPKAYSSSSLHEWSKLSIKVKVSRRNKLNMFLPFFARSWPEKYSCG